MKSTSPFSAAQATLEQIGTGLLRAFIPAGKALAQAGQVLHDVTRQAYQSAGQPYGDTQEGLARWLDEIANDRHRDTPPPSIPPEHK